MTTADTALLARARGEDAQERAAAFDELFLRLRGPTLALCLQLCGSRSDAEDALQETFLAVHEGLAAFRGDSSLSTWVYRIALRCALRAKARHARAGEGAPPEVAARVEGALEARSEGRRVLQAMASLPAEQRAVLALFAVEELKHREIADVLGIPEGTVWSRLHLARKRLAAALEGR